MYSKLNIRFSVILLMILFAAFSRIIPHMPNFSPLGAIGLFGAACFSKKWQAFVIPIAATWLSDLFSYCTLGNVRIQKDNSSQDYSGRIRIFCYLFPGLQLRCVVRKQIL